MSQFKYTELDIWQAARELVSEVYVQSNTLPKDELFSLTNQLRGAAISVPSNIAEGCGRRGIKDLFNSFSLQEDLNTNLRRSFSWHLI